ncbi:MAG: hypothetical protein K8H75_01065 [Sulfuricella sp.]|nr:hypothetical protein [Sulfuricella sp.]
MRKVILFIGSIALLYFGSLFLRAHQWESAAEKYIEAALLDIAKPWSVKKLEERATWSFLEKAKLRPSDIVDLANKSLGSLIEITAKPKCNLQQGTDAYSDIKHTYAICVVTGKFEKSTHILTIRLQDDGDWKNGSWKINDFISVK